MRYTLLVLSVFAATPAMAQQTSTDAYQIWSNCLNMHLMSKMTDCTTQSVYAIGDDDFAACETEESAFAASLPEEERAATMAAYQEELKMRVASSDCIAPPETQANPQPEITPVPTSGGDINAAISATPVAPDADLPAANPAEPSGPVAP